MVYCNGQPWDEDAKAVDQLKEFRTECIEDELQVIHTDCGVRI